MNAIFGAADINRTRAQVDCRDRPQPCAVQSELEQALAKKFRGEYLKNPKVTVTIATLQPYYVMGEVEKPGEFAYKGGLNVLTALAIAGGPTYRASNAPSICRNKVTLVSHWYGSTPNLATTVVYVGQRLSHGMN